MPKAIYFDMDGTLADLYGNPNWKEMLDSEKVEPYAEAKPLLNLQALARVIHTKQKQGYKVGIISWLSKEGSAEYNQRVALAKIDWLKTHLKSVQFDEIHIVKYGTPKEQIVKSKRAILFDDEIKNRSSWKGKAFDEKDIINTIKNL